MKWVKKLLGFGKTPPSAPTRAPTSAPPSEPPTLRNKPGGVARVVGFKRAGLGELNGCIVTTVRLSSHAPPVWAISPLLHVVPTAQVNDTNGKQWPAGERLIVDGIGDEHLIPLNNPGESERDETLDWLPVPATPLVKETIKEN